MLAQLCACNRVREDTHMQLCMLYCYVCVLHHLWRVLLQLGHDTAARLQTATWRTSIWTSLRSCGARPSAGTCSTFGTRSGTSTPSACARTCRRLCEWWPAPLHRARARSTSTAQQVPARMSLFMLWPATGPAEPRVSVQVDCDDRQMSEKWNGAMLQAWDVRPHLPWRTCSGAEASSCRC